ncbi:putative bifunctional diguanylate cyclase/phosphodiesterase [Ideonella sp.]|uniref:putative bifunctional diguanylate cyclase/phosphodiesterase n=1 Tax=Ideonella sp. TaxID=1929293 RepID=UPI002B4A794C|nr:EAL domain-containing protein [Ideonella sp.]HJV69972.1 EAL domain-containing protein [Ideonella sp.]
MLHVTGIKLTVLIVDDTPENIDVLSAVLEGLGCELMAATSGPRALELAARRRPDLILLDVMMPGMDGFEVCRHLKDDMALADIPVIFVTARADDISTGFAVGGADYITKPINADEVLARVRHQIERQVLLRDLRELNRSLEERVRERTAELTLANRQLRIEINERRYMQDRLNYLATHDFVTRQYNRGALDAHVSELLARVQRQATSAVFLLVDIDQFRLVNETCGCVAGDELLRQFAELVGGALTRSDFFARVGGDKFAVVSEDQSEEGGMALARQIHKHIAEFEFQWEERVFRLAASIAVVRIQRDIVSFDQLMLMADEAAYHAKREGRGAICLYDAKRSATDPHRESVNWALVLFDALKQDRLRMHGQRLEPLANGAAAGPRRLHVETLARLWDPVRDKLLMPAQFIAPAERFHLITDIDCWMIGQAVALLGQVPELHERIGQFAINLSAISIRDATLAKHVADLLAQHNVPGRLLCFEITETEAITNLQSAGSFMQQLRDLGCRFALDDFGSGFASFSYLRRLPFDSIKIDGMFVRDMDTDDVHSGMVRSMAEMGRLLNKPVVAECVENERVADMLRSLGIDWGQGYAFHTPEELTPQLLRSWLAVDEGVGADAQQTA